MVEMSDRAAVFALMIDAIISLLSFIEGIFSAHESFDTKSVNALRVLRNFIQIFSLFYFMNSAQHGFLLYVLRSKFRALFSRFCDFMARRLSNIMTQKRET